VATAHGSDVHGGSGSERSAAAGQGPEGSGDRAGTGSAGSLRDVEEFDERLRAEYDGAREAERTAAGFTEWREARITQAAAWVLSTVLVRFCEDQGLIDWLIAAFEHLSDAHPTAAGLFDRRHNPLWELSPSFEAATALIAFWRRRDDTGAIRYDFTGWDTRFLGDLYQDPPRQPARPTRCCRPRSSWRSSSST
jgi:hypothetical protein